MYIAKIKNINKKNSSKKLAHQQKLPKEKIIKKKKNLSPTNQFYSK